MYLVRELNSNKLFQRTSNFVLNENCRDLLPQLFYRASACYLSFQKISQYQHKCSQEYSLFDDQVIIQDNRILFVSQTSISILNEITPIISSLRVMQNQFIGLISKYNKISLPSSMNDFVKKEKKYNLSQDVKQLILDYWNGSGKYLKDLRDIDQHFYYLIENSFMTITPMKKIVILFPDNPESKSPDKFKFNKKIDGIDFLVNAFKAINSLFESFSELQGFEEKDIIFSLGFKHLMAENVVIKRTLFMFFQEYLQKTGSNSANLIIKALFFNQKPNNEVEMYERGLSKHKNDKLNAALAAQKRNDI